MRGRRRSSIPNYRLKVTAGPSYDLDTHKVVPVNAEETLRIESDQAVAYLCVRIQEYTGWSITLFLNTSQKKKNK